MKKEEEKKSQNKSNEILEFLKLYVTPLLSLIFFIAIIFFLIIPKIRTILDTMNENSLLNLELSNKKEDLTRIKSLEAQRNSLTSDLEIINSIAPTSTTEVVIFGNKITSLAQKHSLNINSQNVGESLSQIDTQSNNSVLNLKEVPIRFELSGEYSNVLNFLNELDEIEDFIVFKEFQLDQQFEGVNDVDIWALNLTLVKYQFSDPSEETTEISKFKQVPSTAKVSEIMRDYIDARK